MNNTLVAVGVGGLLLGGVGGFVAGGKGDSAEATGGNSNATKTNRAQVVAVEGSRRSEVIGDLSEVYREPGQTARVQKLLDYYSNLKPDMFEAEAAKLDELPFSERILASYLLFSQWAEVDPIAALAHTDTMGRTGFFVKPTVLQSWASTDPAGAAQFLAENPRDFAMMGMMGGRRGTGPESAIATEWARQDPEAALAWAKGLDGRESTGAIANVIKQVASEDPVAALAMAQGLEGDAKLEAFRSIAPEWAKEDWNAMESWARGLPADQRDAALAEGARGLAQRDPVEAAAKLLTLTEGEARNRAFDDVVESYAQQDPEGAMNFLLSNASEAVQEDSMREAMGPLARTNSTAALEVINSLDDNAVRDRAVSTYVFSATDGDPQETLTLAATIGDDGSRERAVGLAARQWFREDEAAADAYFASSDLIAADTLEEIKNGAQNGGGRDGRRGGGGGGRRR